MLLGVPCSVVDIFVSCGLSSSPALTACRWRHSVNYMRHGIIGALAALALFPSTALGSQACHVNSGGRGPVLHSVRVSGVSCLGAVGSSNYVEGGETFGGYCEDIVECVYRWRLPRGEFSVTVHYFVTKKIPVEVQHWRCRAREATRGHGQELYGVGVATCKRGSARVVVETGS